MKPNYTDITFVLDRSGSMETVRDDTIGGFNAFLATQKATPGEATVTLAQFDTIHDTIYEAKPLHEALPLTRDTFVPRGSTALLDAIGMNINRTGARLAAMREEDRPSKVVFVIVTDGHENSSREFARPAILEMISKQREAYKWEFVFLGANQDAIAAGASIGISAASSMSYAANSAGTIKAFASTARTVAQYRTGATQDTSFSEQDREEQRKAGAQ